MRALFTFLLSIPNLKVLVFALHSFAVDNYAEDYSTSPWRDVYFPQLETLVTSSSSLWLLPLSRSNRVPERRWPEPRHCCGDINLKRLVLIQPVTSLFSGARLDWSGTTTTPNTKLIQLMTTRRIGGPGEYTADKTNPTLMTLEINRLMIGTEFEGKTAPRDFNNHFD